jgi:gliding motility-associated-like protein
LNVLIFHNLVNGACEGSYSIIRTWTASDSCNNTTTHVQTITVHDTTAPTLLTPFNPIENVACGNIPGTPLLQFTDNCSSAANIVVVTNSVTSVVSPTGTYSIIRTWTVRDNCNNQAVFTQTVFVTVQNYLQTATNVPVCNTDIDLTVNVAGIINTQFPGTITPTGTWTDLNNSGGFNSTTGVFTPLNLPDGNYVIQYSNNDPTCPKIVQVTIPVDQNECIPEAVECDALLVHNAFSPNGDGVNEFFIIDNITDPCYLENNVEIYNRWGVLVFEIDNYNNNDRVFRGTSEGRTTVNQSRELPTGTYFYILKYKTDGNYTTKNGYLYLSR